MAISLDEIKSHLSPSLDFLKDSEEYRDAVSTLKRQFQTRPGHRKGKLEAAVLVALDIREDDIYVLLTKRSQMVNRNKGDVCLPGGFVEDCDKSLVDTALREAWEEVGIEPHDVTVLGNLLPEVNLTTYILVTPVVGVINNKNFKPSPNPMEVEDIFYLPLSRFLKARRYTNQSHALGMTGFNPNYNLHIFTDEVEGKKFVTWGVTSRIIIKIAVGVYQNSTEFVYQYNEKLDPSDLQKWEKWIIKGAAQWLSSKL